MSTPSGTTDAENATAHPNSSSEAVLSPNEFRALKLEHREQIGDHVWLFRFAFPEHQRDAPSGLKTGEYICVRAMLGDPPKPTVRYYSPVSTPHDRGHISLVIKIDDAGGAMSWFLRDMPIGDTLEFKGPMGGHQFDPAKYRKYGLIAGGTGISPMVQICREISGRKDDTQASLLYGAVTVRDLVFRKELQRMSAESDGRIRVHFAVDNPPTAEDESFGEDEKNWSVGYITKEMMQTHLPPPGPDTIILLCGPRKMIDALVPQLHDLQYTKDHIYVYG